MKYEQLSDKAKQNAIMGMRDINTNHYWWRSTYKYVGEVAKSLGFAGFEVHGFGLDRGSYVQYDGQFYSKQMKLDELSDKQKDELKEFIEPITEQAALCAIHSQGSYLYANIPPTGNVSLNVDWEVYDSDDDYDAQQMLDGKAIEKAFDAFADWIQARLQDDYDYLTSDEAIEETIIANEYDFDEEGERV
jgi:hypothetical protein